jgi:hypothetical protein
MGEMGSLEMIGTDACVFTKPHESVLPGTDAIRF